MAALQGAYNDDTDACIEDHLNRAPASATPDEPPAPVVAGDKAQAVAQLLAMLGQGNGGLSADDVRQIVRDELPDLIPVTRLEIKTPEGVKDHGTAPRHRAFTDAFAAVACNIPLAMVGPAGSGKTTAAEQIAEALELPFYMNGAVSGAHEYLGFIDAQGRYQTTPFRKAFEHGGVYLADEIDGSDPSAPLVINSALANGHMPFPDQPEPVKRHENFRCIAAANTYGTGADRIYVGRNQLDGATLDRFAFLEWSYDERLEGALCANASWLARVQALRSAATKEKARIIISPRASINGAKLLAHGVALGTVENMMIWKGVDTELRRRIESAAR